MERYPVLLVDDDADIREALTEILVYEGFAVHPAQNGREALDWLQENRGPCVVLLDLMMPVMDGRAFLAIWSTDPSLSKSPVLIVSADPAGTDLAETHAVAGVFSKPISMDGLIGAIEKCTRADRPTASGRRNVPALS